jgi:bifunctional DNA-binding transcriptional regulator/antitoxin component of YhaV-PrlF toxin-antitoxin module
MQRSGDIMSLIRVNPKGQVTIPSSLGERAKLNAGDLVDAKLVKGKITLTRASLIDRHIDESIGQIEKGKFYGPFDIAEQMIESLHRTSKRSKRPIKRSTRR